MANVGIAAAPPAASMVDATATIAMLATAMTGSPLVVEDPKTILLRNVDCYVSGLLASFPRETLNQIVHEVLILYPQSEYAIEKERPILHQRCGERAEQV